MRIRVPQGLFWSTQARCGSTHYDGSLSMNAMGSNRSTQGWKRRSALGAVLLAASACLSAPAAWAANADVLTVTLDVKPADDVSPPAPQTYSVSVSRAGLDSFISYRLRVQNTGGNTVNQVVVKATATVTGGSGIATYAALVNNLDSVAANPNCPAPNATPTNTVTCPIGQLKSGEGRDFFLLFRAPEAGATVEFEGETDFSSGASSSAPPADFTKLVSNSMVLTTTVQQQVNTSVITVLPPRGGKFFTGPNGAVDGTNLFSTSVQVPSTLSTTTPTVTDNRIKQASLPSYTCSPANPGYFCYGLSSDISVDNAKDDSKVDFTPVAGIIEITLRQDSASLTVKKPTPGVFDVKIFYTPTDKPTIELLACGASLPTVDVPCVKSRSDNLKGNKGSYEYLIWARDNGRFSW